MRITERQVGDATVLDVRGALVGHKSAEMFDETVRRLCRGGSTEIVGNLARVPAVDLVGLGALVAAHRAVREAKGVLKLAAITRRIHDLVVITRLLTVFDTYDSVEEAAGREPRAADRSPAPVSAGIQNFLRRA